jgi:hypothetical protein
MTVLNPDGYAAPSTLARLGELRIGVQFLRLAVAAPKLISGKATKPRSVIVLPGFGTGDSSTVPLRAYLSRRGHHCVGWKLDTNKGEVAALLGAPTPGIPQVKRLRRGYASPRPRRSGAIPGSRPRKFR